MSTKFNIGSVPVGSGLPAQCIAEIGANHDGNASRASRMVRAVAETGAKLVKFQFYTAEELVADASRVARYGPEGAQREEPVGKMFDRLSLPREVMRDLFEEARSLGLEPFATPFSEKGADELVEMGAVCIKIASSDVNHLPLLRHVASMGRPVLLSLGKCTLAEADEAICCLQDNGCRELAILHCVASYPSPMHEMNLKLIPALAGMYPDCVVGFSDHSIGLTAAIAAAAMGASIVEKHVTLSRDDVGPDHWFSMEMDELRDLVQALNDVHAAMGTSRKRILPSEAWGRKMGVRSLVTARDLPAGHVLQKEDLKAVRPGGGITPGFLETVTGMRLGVDVPANTPLMWEMLKAS